MRKRQLEAPATDAGSLGIRNPIVRLNDVLIVDRSDMSHANADPLRLYQNLRGPKLRGKSSTAHTIKSRERNANDSGSLEDTIQRYLLFKLRQAMIAVARESGNVKIRRQQMVRKPRGRGMIT